MTFVAFSIFQFLLVENAIFKFSQNIHLIIKQIYAIKIKCLIQYKITSHKLDFEPQGIMFYSGYIGY